MASHLDQQPSQSRTSFFRPNIGVHCIHFDDVDAGGRAKGVDGFAVGLDPVVHRHMTAFQQAAD